MEIPGLSKSESRVYVTLLDLKEAGATKLSEKSGMFRTLVYDVLTKLAEKGLVSYSRKEGKRVYRPSTPKRLLEIIKEKENETKEILPKLDSLYEKQGEDLWLEHYEGPNGMKTVVEDIFEGVFAGDIKEVFFMGPRGASFEYLGAYLNHKIKTAKQAKLFNKIDFRIIWSGDVKIDQPRNLLGKKENHRFLPKEFNSKVPFIIYGDKLAIAGGSERPFVVLLKNADTAESFKHYFKFMWKHARR